MRHRIFKNNKTAIKNQTANKVNIFSDKKGLIVSFFSIIPITVLYKIIDVYNNLTYQLKCGDFYKLPTQYFNIKVDKTLFYLFLCIITISICFYPILIKKLLYNKNNSYTKIPYIVESVVIGLMIGFLDFNITYRFDTYKNIKTIEIIFLYFLLPVLTILLISCVDFITLLKLYKKRFYVIISVSTILLLILWIPIINETIKNINNINNANEKVNYEFIILENEESSKEYAVLSEYDNQLLIVEFSTSTVDEVQKYTFYVNEYQFVDRSQGKLKYVKMKEPPYIESKYNEDKNPTPTGD